MSKVHSVQRGGKKKNASTYFANLKSIFSVHHLIGITESIALSALALVIQLYYDLLLSTTTLYKLPTLVVETCGNSSRNISILVVVGSRCSSTSSR